MREKLVLISRDGVEHNVLKIKPPIIFNKENVDTLIEKLKETLIELLKQWFVVCAILFYFLCAFRIKIKILHYHYQNS